MNIRSKILGAQGVLLSIILFTLGVLLFFLNNSINPLISRLDQDIDTLSKISVVEESILRMKSIREELQQITENYVNTSDESAKTKYDFTYIKLQETVNSALKASEREAMLLNISVVETNIENVERKIFHLISQGNVEEARALLASVEYEVLRENYDTFLEQFIYSNKSSAQDQFSKLVLLSSSIETSRQQLNNLILVVILSFIAVFAIGFAVSFVLSRSISKPIEKLTKGAEIIGKGNLKHRIDIKSKDEVGQLAVAFNEMAEKLEESYKGLERKADEAAKAKVSLEKKVEELERFQNATVGRELKMIELKKALKQAQDEKEELKKRLS